MNLYDLSNKQNGSELTDILFERRGLRLERIVSRGETTGWYDQDEDEWLVLVEGSAVLEYAGRRTVHLSRGDTLFIPAREAHRVASTSTDPPCIWLAAFIAREETETDLSD